MSMTGMGDRGRCVGWMGGGGLLRGSDGEEEEEGVNGVWGGGVRGGGGIKQELRVQGITMIITGEGDRKRGRGVGEGGWGLKG